MSGDRTAYEQLNRGDRIVDIVTNARDGMSAAGTIPVGFGYLVERNIATQARKLGARKKAQLWTVVILGLFEMDTEAWNNTHGLKIGVKQEFWISVDDLPKKLHDDAEQLDLLLSEDDPELAKKISERNAQIDAGLEVDDKKKRDAAVKKEQKARDVSDNKERILADRKKAKKEHDASNKTRSAQKTGKKRSIEKGKKA